MKYKKIFSALVISTLLASLGFANPALAANNGVTLAANNGVTLAHDKGDKVSDRTVQWTGYGVRDGQLKNEICGMANGAPVDGAYLFWVLKSEKTLTAPTITIDGSTYPMTLKPKGDSRYWQLNSVDVDSFIKTIAVASTARSGKSKLAKGDYYFVQEGASSIPSVVSAYLGAKSKSKGKLVLSHGCLTPSVNCSVDPLAGYTNLTLDMQDFGGFYAPSPMGTLGSAAPINVLATLDQASASCLTFDWGYYNETGTPAWVYVDPTNPTPIVTDKGNSLVFSPMGPAYLPGADSVPLSEKLRIRIVWKSTNTTYNFDYEPVVLNCSLPAAPIDLSLGIAYYGDPIDPIQNLGNYAQHAAVVSGGNFKFGGGATVASQQWISEQFATEGEWTTWFTNCVDYSKNTVDVLNTTDPVNPVAWVVDGTNVISIQTGISALWVSGTAVSRSDFWANYYEKTQIKETWNLKDGSTLVFKYVPTAPAPIGG